MPVAWQFFAGFPTEIEAGHLLGIKSSPYAVPRGISVHSCPFYLFVRLPPPNLVQPASFCLFSGMETAEHKELRRVAFFAIVVSTAAVIAAVVTLPMLYSYVANFQSQLIIETDFCKVGLSSFSVTGPLYRPELATCGPRSTTSMDLHSTAPRGTTVVLLLLPLMEVEGFPYPKEYLF